MMATQRGEVRRALRQAFVDLDATEGAGGGATYREVAVHAKVGWRAAQTTVANMARAGELVRVGQTKGASERVWTALYALAAEPPPPPPPSAMPEAVLALSIAMSAMQRRPTPLVQLDADAE